MKKVIIFLLVILLYGCISINFANTTDILYSSEDKAEVLHVDNLGKDPNVTYDMVQKVVIKITTGKYKGKIFTIDNILSDSIVFDIPVKLGDNVLVHIDEADDGSVNIFIADYIRDKYIYILMVIFAVAVILVGKFKGFKTVITIIVSVLLIFKGLIPGLLKGYNPIFLAVSIAVLITVFSVYFISGINRKSTSAILGSIAGVIIAGILAFAVGSKVKLTGLSSEEGVMLLYLPQQIKFNFKELLFAGILLGSLGAVMDVAMSIASTIEEVYKNNNKLNIRELFSSGMTVGKDIMGTMTNTLILAYAGSSIPLLLIFSANGSSFHKFMNLDIIATEMVRSLAGTIGLVLTIPITAFISVMLIKE
ncbi:YibE/F family protein [Helicovermis profundi]|uniref:YibE/F family protein n=1 Tax=Helicovermis profundi TaxID=3065157 RepID=A0AAU9ETC4_9FIRM|nr:YibE/F family protein [Clostridia bacterium S502]